VLNGPESLNDINKYISERCHSRINHLTPNGHFGGRTAPLTSRRLIFFIYSTNIHTEYFKHAAHSPFFPLQNVVYFIMLPFLVPVLFTFFYTGCAKIKKKKFRRQRFNVKEEAVKVNHFSHTHTTPQQT
jgi:thiosulfate reductase cytochrome b subunit